MADRIIAGNRFTSHQKTHIILSIGAPFIITISYLIKFHLDGKGYLVLCFLIVSYSFLMGIAFMKKGLLNIDSDLYRGVFFRGKLLFKKKIDITNTPKIAILKFKRSQKMAWFVAGNPDLNVAFNTFDVHILNEKHTRKAVLISLRNEKKANEVIDFLANNFDLTYEIYSPDFS